MTESAQPAATVDVELPADIFDVENGLILLKGAVPGPKGGLVVVRSSAKARTDREVTA